MLRLALVIAAATAATVIDLRTRRIPDVVTVPLALVGFALAAAGRDGISIGSSVTGFALGLLLMLPGFLLGATGAGDVKLMAAMGAMLGGVGTLVAFLYTAVAGGIIAAAVALTRQRFAHTVHAMGRLVARPVAAAASGDPADALPAAADAARWFPYGPAIAIGTVLAALGF